MTDRIIVRTTYLERLLTCPHQAFLSMEYPSLDKPNEGQERGKTFHAFVRTILDADDREQAYNEAVRDLLKVRPDAIEGLRALWESILSMPHVRVVSTEEHFSHDMVVDGVNVRIVGSIDTVLQVEDELVICDFKLLKNPRNFQPTLQRFTYILFSPYRDTVSAFWFLVVGVNGTVTPYVYSADVIRNDPEFEEHIMAVIRHFVRLQDHHYKRIGKHCNWCQFASICRPNADVATGKILSLVGDCFISKRAAIVTAGESSTELEVGDENSM